MAAAARLGDVTGHPGIIVGGLKSVLIEKRPAARQGDNHACAMPPTAGPHPTSTIVKGSTSVFIGGAAAARMGDTAGCGAPIIVGATTVLIGD